MDLMLQFSEIFDNKLDPLAVLKYPIPFLESLIERVAAKRKKENPNHKIVGELGNTSEN